LFDRFVAVKPGGGDNAFLVAVLVDDRQTVGVEQRDPWDAGVDASRWPEVAGRRDALRLDGDGGGKSSSVPSVASKPGT
jgi:hypothetical protein